MATIIVMVGKISFLSFFIHRRILLQAYKELSLLKRYGSNCVVYCCFWNWKIYKQGDFNPAVYNGTSSFFCYRSTY